MATVKELESVSIQGSDDEQQTIRIRRFALSQHGVTVQLASLGASLTQVLVPSATGKVDDVVLACSSLQDMYNSQNPAYLGVICGRVANRIANGQFVLDGTAYELPTKNDGPHHLHGGLNGFSQRNWQARIVNDKEVQFSLRSSDGDEGYPGTVQVTATYSLQATTVNGVKLCVNLHAHLVDEKPTPINLAQHTYWNLASHNHPDGILDHTLRLNAEAYTPVDVTGIPTRKVQSLDDDVVMDWRQDRSIRDALIEYAVTKADRTRSQAQADMSTRFAVTDPQSATDGAPYGWDHNYVVTHKSSSSLSMVAVLEHAPSQRRLTIRSNAPGVQVYTANGMDQVAGKDGAIYQPWQGIALETQHFPDSIDWLGPGQCVILRPNQPEYCHRVEYELEFAVASTAAATLNDTALAPTESCWTGRDSQGHRYASAQELWPDSLSVREWYQRASLHYEEHCDSTLEGVLGGFAVISPTDLLGSHRFIQDLARDWSLGAACECGAGIGRVTKGLLLDLGVSRCDLVESSSRLLQAAPEYLGGDAAQKCRFFCQGMQEWEPVPNTYSVVWVQWVLCYLTDEHALLFLKRCRDSLIKGGVIVLKENTCDDDDNEPCDFEVDVDDASVTRSIPYLLELAKRAGLKLVLQRMQDDFPPELGLYPVPMLAFEAAGNK